MDVEQTSLGGMPAQSADLVGLLDSKLRSFCAQDSKLLEVAILTTAALSSF